MQKQMLTAKERINLKRYYAFTRKTKTDDQRQEVNDYPVKEQYVLSRLLPEYVSLYRIDLNSGKYEILRLDADNQCQAAGRRKIPIRLKILMNM